MGCVYVSFFFFLSLSLTVRPGLSRYVPVCPGTSRSVPVCPGLSRSVPVDFDIEGCKHAGAKMIHRALLSILLSSVLSVSSKATTPAVRQESKTAFFGEDIHLPVAVWDGEVVFRSKTNASAEVVLLRGGRVLHERGKLNSLGHLVLEDVREEDEGVYTVRNPSRPQHTSTLLLSVRDCALETVVKYGDTYHFPLSNIQGPITLEFRHSPLQANATLPLEATDPPAVVLYNQTAVAGEYVGRLRVSDRKVVLHGVTMTDEGSFTVLDRDGKVRGRNCLNVIKHEDFLHLEYGETLRLNLYLNHSRVSVTYTPSWDRRARPVLDQGVLVVPQDPLLDGRLSVEDSQLLLRKSRVADRGMFRVTDLLGFAVADAHIQVDAFKLSNLYVVILSLLGLIALLLVLCLLSCLYKVHRRNQKNKKLTLLAQQAGKGDGQAFRQVVHEAYTRFTEESQMQSSWEENPTESTEVTIKGLEVSRPGHYHALPSYKEALEMSDSGAECPSMALPLDSDAEGPMTFTSHRLLLDGCDGVGSDGVGSASALSDSTEAAPVPQDPDPSSDVPTPDSAVAAVAAVRSPDSCATSAHPAFDARPAVAVVPSDATPDGSLRESPPGETDPAKLAEEGGEGSPGEGGEGAAI
ncbi:unnamed protein product [Merluccius merluccius]